MHKWCHHDTEKCKGINKNHSSYFTYSSVSKEPIQVKWTKPFTVITLESGKTIKALLDTGADVSCIKQTLVNHLSTSKKHLGDIDVQTFNGNIVKGRWEGPAKLLIFGQTITSNLLTFETLSHEMIIGMDILGPLIENIGANMILGHTPNQKESLNNINNQEVIIPQELSQSLTEGLKTEFVGLFNNEIKEENLCTIRKHSIDTGDHKPVCRDGNRVPIHYENQVEDEIRQLKSNGIIRDSTSPWRSGIVVALKPNGKIRVCIDYRPINLIKKRNAYPMPRIDEILDSLANGKIFSVIDATSGYHQIAMQEEDIQKTAFAWKGQLYEYTRMPFGLCNAPATFQATMDAILLGEKWKCAIPYLDEIIVFSNSIERHQEDLKRILNKLKAAGLTLNGDKCKFFRTEIQYLGHTISAGKIRPDSKKIETILDSKAPITLKDLRSFLGLSNFCSNFIPHYATKIARLTDLLKGEKQSSQKEIDWSIEANQAFENIKTEISKIIERSQPDLNEEFILTTDASNVAMGAVLTQLDENNRERMISCFSKKFDQAQSRYSTTDKELVAVMIGIEHYKHYLLGKHFILKTDHKALEHMQTASNDNSRILRIALKLQNYNFTPKYIKGETNMADFLSRPQERKGIANIQEVKINEEEKTELLRKFHRFTEHGSATTMKFILKSTYSWPGIGQDIERFIEKCGTCLKAGEAQQNTKNRIIKTTRPNELWEVDLIGRIPGSNGTNRFIFMAIDHYTKWLETTIVNQKTGESIEEAIRRLIIQKHGTPARILSDQGLEFDNNRIRELSKEYGFEWILASPRHHETVGAVERVNQTFMNILKKITDFGREKWDNKIENATFAYNISFHRAINTSPYVLKYGKIPKLWDSAEMQNPISLLTERLIQRDKHFENYAKNSIEKGTKTVNYNLRQGDQILVYRKSLSDKFKEKWFPGYRIKEKIPPDAYMVTDGTNEYRFNKAHIKLDTARNGS